ncbi:hypothetical protein LCGC14_2112610, partial [marine sediment metagenome]
GAAADGAVDYLRDFKSNLIMGHIIPGGTGFKYHEKAEKFIERKALEEALYSFEENFKVKEYLEEKERTTAPSA